MSLHSRIITVGAFLLFGFFAVHAHAATITVTATTDDLTINGNCTLREAIKAANTDAAVDACTQGSGSDIVELSAPTADADHPYTLTILGAGETNNATGDLDIKSNITINGISRDQTFIEGIYVSSGSLQNFDDRILNVDATGTLSLNDVTIDNGNATGSGGGLLVSGTAVLSGVDLFGNFSSANGGGIAVTASGSLTATEVNIWLNWSVNGGGLYNQGTVSVDRSFIGGNLASTNGGGLVNSGSATITNTTFTDNTASGNGGGIRNETTGTVSLDSVTIDGNSSTSAAAGILNVGSGVINIQRTILSNNLGAVYQSDCSGTLVSQDYNLIESTLGCSITGVSTHNKTGTDPQLDSQYYSGSNGVLYVPLLYGSGAIDAAGASCLSTDAIGTSRPQRGTHALTSSCDIGAFEYSIDEVAPIVTATVNVGALTTNNQPTFTITSNEAGRIVYSCDPFNSPSGLVSSIGTINAGATVTDKITMPLNDVTYSCRVTVTDLAENVGSSATMVFKIDTHGPTLQMSTVTGTRTTTVVSPYSSVTINISTSELGVFMNSGSCPTPIMNSNGYGAQFTFNLPDGTFTGCTIQMRDSFGNLSNTITPTIIVDTQKPTGRIIGPSLIELKLGQKYIEYGAVGFDVRDASLGRYPTYRRIMNFTDASHAGQYSIGYMVGDSAGGESYVGERMIVVKPKIITLTSVKGKISATFNGTTKTFTPFKGYTGSVYALQVVYGSNASDQYFLFVATMPTGVNKVLWQTWNGKTIGTGALPKALLQTGLNVVQNFDASTSTLLLALGSTRGTNQPTIFALTPTAIKNVSVNKNGTSITGNISLKFLPLMANNSVLVTTVNGRRDSQRVWWYNNNIMKGHTVAQSQVTYDGKTLTQNTPTFRDLVVYANAGGRVVINWKTTVNANYTIEYGASKALGSTVKSKLDAESQQAVLSIPSNSGFWYRITACNPKVQPKVGCASTPINNFISI